MIKLRSDESSISKIPVDFISYYTVTSQYIGGVNTDMIETNATIFAYTSVRKYIVHAQNIARYRRTPTLRKRAQ